MLWRIFSAGKNFLFPENMHKTFYLNQAKLHNHNYIIELLDRDWCQSYVSQFIPLEMLCGILQRGRHDKLSVVSNIVYA